MKKEFLGYLIIPLSLIFLFTHINEFFRSFRYGYYIHVNVLLIIVQSSFFFGINLLQPENKFRKIGKIIFIILCIVLLVSSIIYYKLIGVLFFIQAVAAGIFSYFCILSNGSFNSKIAFLLRIFAVVLFIGAVIFRFQDSSYNNTNITFFLGALAVTLFLLSIAQILNPISKISSLKLYGSLFVYHMLIMIWAKDITYSKTFMFHENKLSYSHALLNNSFEKLFGQHNNLEIEDNEIRKKYRASELMIKKCNLYTYYTERNDHSEYLEKLIIEVVKNDFNYYKLYQENTGSTVIDINKIIENKSSIFKEKVFDCPTC